MGHSDTIQIKKETDGYVEIEQKRGDSEKGWVCLGGIHYFCFSKGSLFELRYKCIMYIFCFIPQHIVFSGTFKK